MAVKQRSFRVRLAVRFTALTVAILVVAGAVGFVLLRHILMEQLDSALLRLAPIEAAAASDAPGARVHYHEGTFGTPQGESPTELARFAEIWGANGQVLLRSQSLGGADLPRSKRGIGAARAGTVTLTSDSDTRGQVLRSVYYPLSLVSSVHAGQVLQVSAPIAPVTATLTLFVRYLIGLGVAAAAAALWGGWVLARAAVWPAREIAEQAEAITASSLGARIRAHVDATEYQRLVVVLNDMLARLDAAFAAERRFVADASHEIRHPLAVLRASLDLALRRPRAPEEYRASIQDALDQADRVTVLANGLLALARIDAGVLGPRCEWQDVGEFARSVIGRFEPIAHSRGIALAVHASPCVAAFDASLVSRALDNLLDNALRYAPAKSTVELVVSCDDEAARIHVTDGGPGVAPEHRPHLFDRFFRGDHARSADGGVGLGLAITRGIVEAHGGSVSYAPVSPTGSRFSMSLPTRAHSPAPAGSTRLRATPGTEGV